MSEAYMQLLDLLPNRPPVRLRASSVSDLFDCADRWCSVHLEGKRVPQTDRAAMGTAIHAGTAHYDTEILNGQAPSILAATQCAVDTLRDSDEDTVWDLRRDEAESIAAALTNKYCREESSKHEFVAVEAKCESLILNDVSLELTGSTDRIFRNELQFGVADIKSGIQAVSHGEAKTQAHAPQIGVYEILGEASTGVRIDLPAKIIGMKTGKTPAGQEIATSEIRDAKAVLLGDENRPGLLHHAALIIHGIIPPFGNPRSMLCNKKFCPNFNDCFWRR